MGGIVKMETENRGGARPGAGRPAETEQLPIKGEQRPPEKPDGLRQYASELWDLAVESLPHVLRPVDVAVLRLCCEAYQMAMDCVADPDMKKEAISAMTKFDSLAKQIGLTPHSRRVIKPAASEKQTEDPLKVWRDRAG